MKRKIRCAAGVFLIGMLPVLPAAAEEAEVIGQPGTMEIPISETMPDLEGENVLVKEPVSVSDADGDGILTVNDALNLAGDAIRDPPDASNVYVYAVPDLDELLAGLDSGNGGVTGSDHANAYIYKEASYFDRSFVTVDPGAVFTLTLRRTGCSNYDRRSGILFRHRCGGQSHDVAGQARNGHAECRFRHRAMRAAGSKGPGAWRDRACNGRTH